MNKTILSLCVFVLVVGLVFYFLFAPKIWPTVKVVTSQDLMAAGKDSEGNDTYLMVKQEAREWLDILGPVIGFLFAYFLKGRKK